MAEKTLYLIRHAEPDYPNGERLCLGQKNDLPLSAAGHAQAALLAGALADIPLEAVYASPLLRAKQTAVHIAGSRPLHVLDDLIELYGGEWDGMAFADIREKYPQYFTPGAARTCPPGGESDESGLARARAALAFIEARTRRCAAIVAHSGINRILLCSLLGRPLEQRRSLKHGYAATSILRFSQGIWTVEETGIAPQDAAARLHGGRKRND